MEQTVVLAVVIGVANMPANHRHDAENVSLVTRSSQGGEQKFAVTPPFQQAGMNRAFHKVHHRFPLQTNLLSKQSTYLLVWSYQLALGIGFF